jgi:hypothetical protein
MKKQTPYWKMSVCLAAAGLALLGSLTAGRAQTALNGQLVLRPLTANDVTIYGLPANSELSGGLTTVGIGTAVYLDAEVNSAIPAGDVTNVVWSVTAKPPGSSADFAGSPLGTNVPVYEPSDRLVSQVVARKLFRPDFTGQYTLTATISTASEGTVAVSQTITASTYMGVQTCSACHSGSVLAEDKWHSWITTGHSHIFTDEINGQASLHGTSCLQCHTTGYSYNTNVMDGGFSSMAAQYGWTIPSVLTNGNWESMQTNYPEVAKMANVQCESCHGPGFNHASLFGNTNSPAWPSISVSFNSGDCNQCHDQGSHHIYGTEWLSSMHAVTTTHPSGPGEESCVGCHTGKGFIQRLDGVTNNIDTAYNPINCQACHEPHGETVPTNNPSMIRTLASATFTDGTIVTNGGKGLLCMQCHHSRVDAKTYAGNPNNAGSRFGPHHGPQGDMIEGVNGYTYNEAIPSSAHGQAVADTCVTCHMQPVGSASPQFTLAGGHTFNVSSSKGDLVAACQNCHGSSVTSFDIALKDYDGDGVVEGVQTEVHHLMDKLSTLLPNAQGVIDGKVKVPVTAKTWTAPQMEAAFNYQFVLEDGSYGIHNTAYAVGLLKASIANLTGDANNDGLPDSWQIQYFGSTTAPEAAPNAVNNASGAPNWMMYALGLAPTAAFTVDGSGTVFFNGNNIVNGATNTIAIYTAAEIAFDTQAGTSYQIQGISNLSGTWSNISTNIPGTGGTISYVVPTRDTAQMFFRVVHTP